jgi:hypothetical protein
MAINNTWSVTNMTHVDADGDVIEAKARVEANRTARVQGQIDRAATQASGVPW